MTQVELSQVAWMVWPFPQFALIIDGPISSSDAGNVRFNWVGVVCRGGMPI